MIQETLFPGVILIDLCKIVEQLYILQIIRRKIQIGEFSSDLSKFYNHLISQNSLQATESLIY